MKEKTSALNSSYIIDGVALGLTPAEILNECLSGGISAKAEGKFRPIVDETTDPSPSADRFEGSRTEDYLEKTSALMGAPRGCPKSFSGPYTKSRIAKALLDSIWMKGHFKLSDLELQAKWKWNTKPVGNMASFYSSVESAAEFIDGLDIYLSGYSFSESEKLDQVAFKVEASSKAENDEDIEEEEFTIGSASPFGSDHAVIGRRRALPDKVVADPESWLIYIPFDTCDFRLGSSLLCQAFGENGDPFPEIGDADYFIDCFEVVREFVEDKVAISAVTVGDGGLLSALKLMCSDSSGADIDISGIMSAYAEDRSIRVLFSEVPGAIIQIKDIDYDYVDAELLLQDIAYYPLGHPVPGSGKVHVKTGGSHAISGILQSLLSSQASEGED